MLVLVVVAREMVPFQEDRIGVDFRGLSLFCAAGAVDLLPLLVGVRVRIETLGEKDPVEVVDLVTEADGFKTVGVVRVPLPVPVLGFYRDFGGADGLVVLARERKASLDLGLLPLGRDDFGVDEFDEARRSLNFLTGRLFILRTGSRLVTIFLVAMVVVSPYCSDSCPLALDLDLRRDAGVSPVSAKLPEEGGEQGTDPFGIFALQQDMVVVVSAHSGDAIGHGAQGDQRKIGMLRTFRGRLQRFEKPV